MDELTLYLGTLAAIGIGALVLIVIVLTRGSGGGGGNAQQRLRSEHRAVAVPRVQVVLAEPDEGLIWVINGRATRELAAVTDPTERRAIQLLLERVREVELPFVSTDELRTETLPPQPRAIVEREGTATHPLAPSQEGESEPESGTGVEPLSNTDESPAMPPSPSSYEDELTRPFLSRLRDSLFGVDYDTKPSAARYAVRPPTPSPKKGKAKETTEELGFGLPRFEELNLLLQQRLLLMPDAPPTTIRVGREGMIEILVQGRVYDHIDDVPDDSVRQAMREAVAIWNSK